MAGSDLHLPQQIEDLVNALYGILVWMPLNLVLEYPHEQLLKETGGDVQGLGSIPANVRAEVLANAVAFCKDVDIAEELLDAVPRSVLEDLSKLSAGVPWDMVTRRILKAIRHETQVLRWHARDPDVLFRLLHLNSEASIEKSELVLKKLCEQLNDRILDLQSVRCSTVAGGNDAAEFVPLALLSAIIPRSNSTVNRWTDRLLDSEKKFENNRWFVDYAAFRLIALARGVDLPLNKSVLQKRVAD